MTELESLAGQIKAYRNIFHGYSDQIVTAINHIRTLKVTIDVQQFKELVDQLSQSIQPDPRSDFFALLYGNEMDKLVKIQSEVTKQLELSKQITGANFASFDRFVSRGEDMTRGTEFVRGRIYTPHPDTPLKPNYRDQNPENRVLPVTNSALRQIPLTTYNNQLPGQFYQTPLAGFHKVASCASGAHGQFIFSWTI